MTWKKELLKKSGLYLVADNSLKENNILNIIKCSLDAGLDIIQLRHKDGPDRNFFETGLKIKRLLKKGKNLFIVNDRVDLALALQADGVHLGQKDIPVKIARKLLGRKKIVGLSAHSIEEAVEALDLDIDYIAIGAVFPTPIKPDYNILGLENLRKLVKRIDIPLVAIGGINELNISDVVKTGVKRIAVVRAIMCAKDPYFATKNLLEKMRGAQANFH